jgi:hypothetical protein
MTHATGIAGKDKNSLNRTKNRMKETIAPVTSAVANGTSVSYSYSPSLQGSADILADSFSNCPNPMARDRSLFLRQGDYWTICYQGQIVLLKATRGLHYLALLLRNPGREFHVSDLAGHAIGKRLALGKDGHTTHSWRDPFLSDAGPVLDAQAKAQYKHRLDDLRGDLEEAEQFNDLARAERQGEMGKRRAVASAIDSGRNRRIGSDGTRRPPDQANQKLNQQDR